MVHLTQHYNPPFADPTSIPYEATSKDTPIRNIKTLEHF